MPEISGQFSLPKPTDPPHVAAVFFGRPATRCIASRFVPQPLLFEDRWIRRFFITLPCLGRSDTALDEAADPHHARARPFSKRQLQHITHTQCRGRLQLMPGTPHLSRLAHLRRHTARFKKPHGPKPLIGPDAFGHGAVVSAKRKNDRPLVQISHKPHQSPLLSTLMKASCGILTLPNIFIFFLPSFCFSSSLRLRVMSPP